MSHHTKPSQLPLVVSVFPVFPVFSENLLIHHTKPSQLPLVVFVFPVFSENPMHHHTEPSPFALVVFVFPVFSENLMRHHTKSLCYDILVIVYVPAYEIPIGPDPWHENIHKEQKMLNFWSVSPHATNLVHYRAQNKVKLCTGKGRSVTLRGRGR